MSLAAPVVLATDEKKPRYLSDLTDQEKYEMALPLHQEGSAPEQPFNVLANVYSVGAKNIGVYLIATDSGHILIDSGTREMESLVIENIQSLGFDLRDIKILLATHAHFDHIQAHAAIQKATGAKVVAMDGDAQALERGLDLSPLDFEGWPPVNVDRVLQHGDAVSLGGMTLTASQIPGHTPGCTVWTFPVTENERRTNLAIFGCRGPNPGVQLNGNPLFPYLVEQTLLGIERLKQLSPDIYLSNHPKADIAKWGKAMKNRERPHPMRQQQPWEEMVAELEAQFVQPENE